MAKAAPLKPSAKTSPGKASSAKTSSGKPSASKAASGKTSVAKPRSGKQAGSDQPKSPAEWAHDRLVLYIRNFEAQLDSKQEIAMGLAGDEAGVLRIEGIGFFDPDMITFYGRDEGGAKTQLIQHVSQLSVTLRAVPKETEEEPPRRIGFQLDAGWVGGDSGDGSVG